MAIFRLPRLILATLVLVGSTCDDAIAELPTASFDGLSRPNGKQVLRLGREWLVVTPEPSGTRAWLSSAPLDGGGALPEWEKVLFLSPDDKGLFRSNRPSAVPPSLALDRGGRLHAAWGDGEGVWYARAKPQSAKDLGERSAWTAADGKEPTQILADATFGDLAVSEQHGVWIAAVKRTKDGQTTVCLGQHGRKWEFEEVATDVGFHPPVLHLAADGAVHVAWCDTRGRVLYLRHRYGEKSEPQEICKGGFSSNGRWVSIIEAERQLIVAYENLYAQVEYAVFEQGKWRLNQRLTSLDKRLSTDVLHSPQLALDRHGVVWLFFSDATRKFTYFTRWLGSSWSDIYDCRGIYYRAPRFESDLIGADWIGIEKYPPPHAHHIGMSLANSLATEKKEFHRIAVPAPVAAAGSTTLFLDMLETAFAENVEVVLDEVRKGVGNPVFTPGPAGSFDQDRVLNHGTVLFDQDKFRMWYGAAHRQRGVYWWEWMRTGYAESKDGLKWERIATGEAGADKDAPHGNREPVLPWPCAVFKDALDPNLAGRYKAVQFDRHQLQLMASLRGEYDMDSPVAPGVLCQSADGLHWKSEPISISFPDGKPWELVVQSFFIDPAEPDPARRWKIYGYATLAARRRAGCFAYSADGRTWTSYPRNPILDPTVSEVPMIPAGPEAQIHDTIVFPYHGYYLGLFHAEHNGYFLDVELAASRDGENFVHVKSGQKVIPLGPDGAFDSQQILQTTPVVAHDKLWIYYGGMAPPAGEKLNNEAVIGKAGLGTLRLDGFTHLSLRHGQQTGSFTTVPIEIRQDGPLSLAVNADCNSDATIAVELLDAKTSQPVAGFARNDCRPLATDGLRHVVQWKQGEQLPLDGRQQFKLRFWLECGNAATGPRLYGFSFSRP